MHLIVGVVVGMPTRITLRVTGAANGKKGSLPNDATMADLLALATTKLALPQPAKRVFDASGIREMSSMTTRTVRGKFHCKKTCTSVTMASCHELRRVGIALRGFQPL